MTWSRFRELMISLGEEPILDSRPLESRYDAWDLHTQRGMDMRSALKGGLLFNNFGSRLAVPAGILTACSTTMSSSSSSGAWRCRPTGTFG